MKFKLVLSVLVIGLLPAAFICAVAGSSGQFQADVGIVFNDAKLKKTVRTVLTAVLDSVLPEIKTYIFDVDERAQQAAPEIEGAAESIQNAVDQVLAEASLEPALENVTVENIQVLKGMLRAVLLPALTEKAKGALAVRACTCPSAPLSERIILALNILADVLKKHPDRSKKLVYTSLAAGGLWQDYVNIQALKAYGYINIDVHLIDLESGSELDVARKVHEIEVLKNKWKDVESRAIIDGTIKTGGDISRSREGADLLYTLRHAEYELADMLNNTIFAFKHMIGARGDQEKLANGLEQPGIYVYNYENQLDYIVKAQKYDAYKADILILVDPDRRLFPTSFPSAANGVAVVLGKSKEYDMKKQSFVLFAPKNSGVVAYHNINLKQIANVRAASRVYDVLRTLVMRNDSLEKYNPQLVARILEEDFSKKYINMNFVFYVLFNSFFPFSDLTNRSTREEINMLRKALYEVLFDNAGDKELISQIKEVQKRDDLDFPIDLYDSATAEKIIEMAAIYKDLIKVSESPYGDLAAYNPELIAKTVEMYPVENEGVLFPLNDPYIAFQDIMRSALADSKNALVYCVDYTQGKKDSGQFRRLDPQVYVHENVIEQQIGQALIDEDGFKKIDFSKPEFPQKTGASAALPDDTVDRANDFVLSKRGDIAQLEGKFREAALKLIQEISEAKKMPAELRSSSDVQARIAKVQQTLERILAMPK